VDRWVTRDPVAATISKVSFVMYLTYVGRQPVSIGPGVPISQAHHGHRETVYT
jgi:hypothetical protein